MSFIPVKISIYYIQQKSKGGENLKNCVVFNDLSGYGNCSLMAAIPVLTVMGVRVHPVPTAVLTCQTGYDRYSMEDLTGFMPQFTADWQEVQPDGIITGFLSNPAQGDCIADFLAAHRTADTLLVVDPVMADDGSLYDGFDEARCNAVRRLAAQADVLTPNVNELALLCGAEYTEDPAAVRQMGARLAEDHRVVAVTGYRQGTEIHTLVFAGGDCTDLAAPLRPGSFSGTGDLFVSVFTGGLLRGRAPAQAAKQAVDFLSHAIAVTHGTDPRDGVDFEKIMEDLL